MERTSSEKLDEMLSFQKAASNKTGLWYEFFSPNIASSSKIVFVSPANDNDAKKLNLKLKLLVRTLDKGKSIVREPPKF